MAGARRVALLGNSVVASSFASTLRNRPELEVVQLAATLETARQLRDRHPDAIILCELATIPHELIFLILEENPGLPVIGVDGERAVVLSSRQASLWTEDDLLGAIGQPQLLQEAYHACPEVGREQADGAGERWEQRRQS